MLEVLASSLTTLLMPQHLLHLVLGTVLGFFIGLLPGLGGIVGLSLMLPFIYGMDPTSAFALLVGLLAVLPTSDTFASILMGIPGSTASQATVLDGFALAKKGQAGRALAAAFFSSMIGGLFGALVLTALVVVARPIILSFGSSELFMLALFGLSMVGVLSGSSLTKGTAACALGLVLGAVGAAPATGEYRMDFGLIYLGDGLSLVIVALGIFALPEIVDLIRNNQPIAAENRVGQGWIEGLRDTLRNRWLVLRCSGIGAVIGIIPGLGNSVMDWIAYGHTVQTSRDRSGFGKGDVRGVIGPEAANNSTAGGALFPTLLFGIPASGSMAIFLAGMVLLGVTPGPAMADPERNLNITYSIVWSLALANIFGTAMCIAFAPLISKITTIRYPVIAPFMVLIVTFAAFQVTRGFEDLVMLLCVGVLGMALRRFGWPRPAFLIGFVLSGQIETYFYQALQFHGPGFLLKPLPLVILGLTALSVFVAVRMRSQENVMETEGTVPAEAGSRLPTLLFTGFAAVVMAFALYDALQHSFLAGIFTIMVGILGCLAAIVLLISQVRATPDSLLLHDAEAGMDDRQAIRVTAWIGGLVVATGLVGFFIAIVGFFGAFLRYVAGLQLQHIGILTGLMVTGLLLLASRMNLLFPGGLLQVYFDLPWPFR